jgi:predicted TIM-barrel fold metal-dependent hydrolase
MTAEAHGGQAMLRGYRISDVDGHVQEPQDLWERWLEPEYLADAPKLVEGKRYYRGQERNAKLSDAVKARFAERTVATYRDYLEAGWDPHSQIHAMDRMGVDVSFLYPTDGLFMWHYRNMEPATAAALTRAYNNWLDEFCRYEPKRLRPVAALSLQDPGLALEELRRATDKLGMRVVYIRPNPIDGRTLGHPDFEPLWTECEQRGVAIGIHEGAHCQLETAGADRFETDFALWSCSHPMEQMMALLSFLEAGVLERHPALRIAFLEAGCGWVPYWLWRLDQRWHNVAFEVEENVRMAPSDYFRRQCFVALEADEPYIADVIEYIGADRLLFASDYPHPDHEPDLTDEIVRLENRLSRETLTKILDENPRALYGDIALP